MWTSSCIVPIFYCGYRERWYIIALLAYFYKRIVQMYSIHVLMCLILWMGKGCREQSRHETLVCVCGGCRREAGVLSFASGATLDGHSVLPVMAFLCPAQPTAVCITRVRLGARFTRSHQRSSDRFPAWQTAVVITNGRLLWGLRFMVALSPRGNWNRRGGTPLIT